MERERYGQRTNFNAGWEEEKTDDTVTLTYKDKNIFINRIFLAESTYKAILNVEREYLKARTKDSDINIITDEDKRNIEKMLPNWIDSVDGYIEILEGVKLFEDDYLEVLKKVAEYEASKIFNKHKKVNLVLVEAPFKDKKKGAVVTVKRIPNDKSPITCSGGGFLVTESNLRVHR